MEFVQNFTPLDFQAKNFTPSISPNFNSFSNKKHKKMSENGEIYTAGKNFTLPPALTGWTNSTSVSDIAYQLKIRCKLVATRTSIDKRAGSSLVLISNGLEFAAG